MIPKFICYLIITLILNPIILIAQNKTVPKNKVIESKIELNKNEDVLGIENLGASGFLLTSGKKYAGRDAEVRLHKFDENLKKLWSSNLSKSVNTLLANYFVASPYTPYIYHIASSKISRRLDGKVIITKFDEKGKATIFEMKSESNLKNLQNAGSKVSIWPDFRAEECTHIATFSDEEHLYLIVSFNKINSKKEVKTKNVAKKQSTIVFYKMPHKSKQLEKLETEFTLEADNKDEDLFVEYLGHDDENIYLAKKTIDFGAKQIKYTVFTLNKTGEKTDENDFELNLESTPVASINLRMHYGGYIADNDYRVVVTRNGNTTTTTYYIEVGSFGCSQLNQETGSFYVYGLSKGPAKKAAKESKSTYLSASNTIADNFYITQFNFSNGEVINSKELPLPKEILADKAVSNPNLFLNRSIALQVLSENVVRLSINSYKKDIHTITCNLDSKKIEYAGKAIEPRKFESFSHRNLQSPLLATKLESTKDYVNFLKNHPNFRLKEYSLFGFFMGSNRVIAINKSLTKTPVLELYLYPNSEDATTQKNEE